MSAAHVMGYFGQDLTEADYRALEGRFINRHLADQAGIRRADNFTGRAVTGRKDGDMAGLLIGYTLPGETAVREYRLRRDHPDMEIHHGKPRECMKYVSPPGRGNLIFFPPDVNAEMLSNVEVPILITEGEFKALAASRAALHKSDTPQFVAVGLSGVWNWKSKSGKGTGPNGERRSIKAPIADLDRITWTDRKVIIAFDADAQEKEQVAIARDMFTRELLSRGARVAVLEWDKQHGKGIDDALVKVGPETVLGWIATVNFDPHNWRSSLLVSETGKAFGNLNNAIEALKLHPAMAGVLAFNEFALTTYTLRPTPWNTEAGLVWGDHDDRQCAAWFQRNGIPVTVETAGQAVQVVAKDRCFHPVRQYLDGREWDKTKRLGKWLTKYLGVTESDYSRAVGERWCISAVARIYQPGCKADCALIAEGPQGAGKSRAVKILGRGFSTDELSDFSSKDSSMQVAGIWIVELAELDSLSRAETSRVKAFMSRGADRFRPPYGRRIIEAPRQSVFFGTVNHGEYLKDETGARRFWPVKCGVIDIAALERDVDQLWAESVAMYRAGKSWWLDTDALVEKATVEQASRYDADPWDKPIAEWIEGHDSVSVEAILEHCIAKPRAQLTQTDRNRVARCLKSLHWERFRRRVNGALVWEYHRES